MILFLVLKLKYESWYNEASYSQVKVPEIILGFVAFSKQCEHILTVSVRVIHMVRTQNFQKI